MLKMSWLLVAMLVRWAAHSPCEKLSWCLQRQQGLLCIENYLAGPLCSHSLAGQPGQATSQHLVVLAASRLSASTL